MGEGEINFLSVYFRGRRGLDSQADMASLHLDDYDPNMIVNGDTFAGFACENEHSHVYSAGGAEFLRTSLRASALELILAEIGL